MARGMATIGLLLVFVGTAWTCDAREAACEQTLTALCELESVCGGGPSIGECRASRLAFTCTVTVGSSATCVTDINDILNDDCVGYDTEALPCPLLEQAGQYEPCSETLVCAADAPCVEGLVDEGPICSADCDAETRCPAGGGCSEGGFCAPFCSPDFLCADFDVCTFDGCVACAALCGDGCGAVVEGCECPACPECVVDDDCGAGVCVDGVCG